MLSLFENTKKNPAFAGLLLSSFPSLVLTRSGNMGIFSDSFQKHPKKREQYRVEKSVPATPVYLIIFSHYSKRKCLSVLFKTF